MVTVAEVFLLRFPGLAAVRRWAARLRSEFSTECSHSVSLLVASECVFGLNPASLGVR
jgi:hypothetical protein